MSWRRILLLAAVLLSTVVGATWFLLQRSATPIVRAFLESELAAAFELGSAEVDLLAGRLTMTSFAIADPSRRGATLAAIDSVRLGVETDPFGGLLAVHDVEVDGARLDVDLTTGHVPEPRALLRHPSRGDAAPKSIPPVHLAGAAAHLLLDPAVPALEFDDIDLRLQRNRDENGDVDSRRGSITGRVRLRNLDLVFDLLGDLDLAANHCRLQAQLNDVAIDRRLQAALQPFLNVQIPADAGHGRLRSLTLWCDIPLAGAAAPAFGAVFELDDVHCELKDLPLPLRGAKVRGVADSADHGTMRITAHRLLADGETEVTSKVTGLFTAPRVELRGKGSNVPLDATVQGALRTFPAGRAVIDGLRPTAGRGSFELYLRDPGADTEIVDLDLDLEGVALTYNGFGPADTRVRFPLPIVGARGHVQLRDDVVSIEDVHGQIAPEAGGGEVSMSGRVDPHGSGVDQVSIDLEAHPLAFTPALRAAVSELVHDQGELYDRFQPTGAAAVRLRVRPRSDPDGDWQVRIEPLGAEMTWAGFPLPLPNLTGSVRARPEGLDLDLAARRDGASVQVQGMLHAPPEHPGSFTTGGVDVRVRADAVPIDAYLRGAATHLSPQLQTVFDELSPTGTCSADLTVHRDRGDDEFVYDLALQLAGGTALPKALPMLVTALHGDVFVHGIGQQTEVQVDTVRGHLQERDGHAAELAVIGTVHTGPTYAEDLTAAVRFLELDPELGRVLEAGGQVGKGTWSVLVPSGKVDVVCRQFREGKVPPQHTYTVLMRDVRSDAEMLPQPATEITGELDVTASALAFHDLRARVGKSLVTCSSGRVGPADDGVRTKVEFSVSAERFPLDDNFSHLFLGPLRQAVVERQLHGAINVNGLSLQFLLPAEGTEQPIETILQGNVEALGVEVLLGTRLAGINGVVRLDESHVTRDGGTLRGNMTRGSFSILGHPCLDAQADFVADADRFVLRDLAFQMHGGKISTRPGAPESLVYVLAKNALDPGRLSTDLEIQGLSLSEFLHDSGFVDAPYSGTVNGWIRLNELRGTDLVHVDAAGELKVVDGNLGTVPLFTSIYALMAEVNRPRFDGMSVKFQVKDRVLALNDLVVGSPLVSVRGEGTMTMEGYLYIVLTTGDFFGGDADPVFIPWLLKLVTSNLVRFHLFGYLRDLHAEKRWIAQHNPRRQRLMPVAPRMDRPRRPDF